MYKAVKYTARTIPNPYNTDPGNLRREEFAGENWTGYERRPGAWDNRPEILERDGYTCQKCGASVTEIEAQVDHIKPRSRYKRPEAADMRENCWTLCYPCHIQKTQFDRQVERRVR